MSYDFLMMKPKVEIRSQADFGEDTLLKQVPQAVVDALEKTYPGITWSQSADGGWFGFLDGDDGRYEFRIGPETDYAWTIHTSHRAATRSLVPTICRALGLVAFNGQAMTIIGSDGEECPA